MEETVWDESEGENMTLEDLPDTIKDHLVVKMARDKKYDDNRFGVTELFGCMRKLWYKRKDPAGLSLGQSYVFNRGMIWDTEYTALFKRNQVRVTHRVPNTEIVISGKIDFVDDDGAIADLKTIENLHFIRKNGAKDANIRQVLFYCWCEGISRGRLYYCTMGDVERVDIDASYTAQVDNLTRLEETAVEAYHMLKCLTEPPAPDAEHTPSYWECCYEKSGQKVKCEYFERCHGNVDV